VSPTERQALVSILSSLSGDLGEARRLCESTCESALANGLSREDARRALETLVRDVKIVTIKLEGVEMALSGVN
jgi:hypothetical protein